MELTKLDRLMLANQYRILSFLDEDSADYYDKMREALEQGYESAYAEIFRSIYDPLPQSETSLVADAMNMYFHLRRCYKALDDQTGIEEWRTKFPGFDGNDETAYMTYARYLVGREGLFSHLEADNEDFNSHAPIVEEYRKMIEVWKATDDRHRLTREDIISILDAG